MIFPGGPYLNARIWKNLLVLLFLLPIWYSGFAHATAPLGIELVSSLNPSVTGQAVTLTAILHGYVNDGTVTFRTGTTELATVPVSNNGAPPPLCPAVIGAICIDTSTTRVSFTSSFTHTGPFPTQLNITATYNGNASHSPSTTRVYFQVVSPTLLPASSTSFGTTASGSADAIIAFTGGGPNCRFQKADWISMRSVAMAPSDYLALTSKYAFPHGLVDFVTTNCTPGATLSFAISFFHSCRGVVCTSALIPISVAPNSVYWKFGPTPSNPVPHWYELPLTLAQSYPGMGISNVIRFTITDGGLGDDDLTANGTIVDQGGPGVPIVVSTIPTTTKGPLFALGGLLLLLGIWVLRKRQTAPPPRS